MAGRTTNRYVRFYMDGYDLSGYSRTVSPLTWEFDTADLTCQMSDGVRGYLPNKPTVSPGTLNGVFDNTATSGLHVLASAQNSDRVIMIPVGCRAAPVAGDPVFCGEFVQLGYQASEDAGAMIATIPFGPWEVSSMKAYNKPWGTLAHAKAAVTTANTGAGYDDGAGAATAFGGYIVVQGFAGATAGTATITLEHCATADGSFAAVGGLTTGDLDFSTVQKVVAVTTAKTTTINRYVRWQIALTGLTTVTFAMAFVRGTAATS
jgi:hypothetical protein